MAIVTRKFRDDFERWAAMQLQAGHFTQEEMTEYRELVRRDLEPGPDQNRSGIAAIDDQAERIRLWSEFLADAPINGPTAHTERK